MRCDSTEKTNSKFCPDEGKPEYNSEHDSNPMPGAFGLPERQD